MLNHLIRFSLNQRLAILGAMLALLVLGGYRASKLPVDVLPDLTKPTVTLITEAPGYAPEEVENLITRPLENALMGVNGLTRLRTVNDVSLSLSFIEFGWGTDIYRARQYVQERLTTLEGTLPPGITPYMAPATSLMGDILLIGLSDPSGQTSPKDLRETADWIIARRLRKVQGVAEVLAMGGGVKQIHIQPNPDKLLAYDLTYQKLKTAAANAVSNTTGGFLTEQDQEIMVRNLAMTTNLDTIGQTPVAHRNGRPILLNDLANITWDTAPMRGDAGIGTTADGESHPGVILSIRKSLDQDTIKLTQNVEHTLAELQKTLPENLKLTTLYRQTDYIDLSIGNLKEALRDGAIMVALVLFLFLLNLRVTLISLTAIPLSLAITVLTFDAFGLGVNSMTLGGLAVAIGMVVDDAIVDVENVYRRLREHAARSHHTSPPPTTSKTTNPKANPSTAPQPHTHTLRNKLKVIAQASSEVRSSILYATILIILVFIPLLALTGVEGRLFTPIAIATIVSMAASFLVSLTAIPVLSSYLLNPKPGRTYRDIPPVRLLKALFRITWLRPALSQPLLILLLTLGLLFTAWQQAQTMGRNFLPPFREPTAVVAMTAAPGTSLETTTQLAHSAQRALLQIPGLHTVGFRAGRAEKGDHVVPVSTVEFEIEFDKHTHRERSEIIQDIRHPMQTIPGTFSALSSPLADRIGHMLSGVNAQVAIKLYGPNLETLRQLGAQITNLARSIPGMEEARPEQQASVPQLRIEINRPKALAYGLTPGELNTQLATLIGGEKLARVYQADRTYDLLLRLPPAWRENPDQLRHLTLRTQSGQRVPLHRIAHLRPATGPNNILRENAHRRFVISINPTTNDLEGAVQQLQQKLNQKLTLPPGYSYQIEGQYQAQQQATRTILISSLLVLLLIITLLYSYFQSIRLVLLVLTNIPLALLGAIYYTKYSLDNISIATLVGFIAITGIAARNSIMLLSHYLHLIRHEGETFNRQLIERGAQERLIPILMTALSAALALVPLLLETHEPGKEILNPVAIAIVGGLVSSTLLGLGLTPTLFYHTCQSAAAKALQKNAPASR